MGTLKIKTIEISNFKGIEKLKINLDGDSASIYGRNRAGKTTVIDAVFWLLFGKDSANQKKFEIKPLVNGEPVHNVEHSVAALLEHDGRELTLARTYKEKYVKKRGQAQATFTGHTTSYRIDGVPCKLKEYREKVAEVSGSEELFQLLSSPKFFSEKLTWQKQREMLFSVCGQVDDGSIIEQFPELLDAVGNRTVDDYKAIIAERRKEINKSLETIPARIDENKRLVVEAKSSLPSDAAELQLRNELEALRERKKDIEKEVFTVENGGKVSEIKIALHDIEAETSTLKQEYSKAIVQQIETGNAEARGLQKKLNELTTSMDKTLGGIESAERLIKDLEHKNNGLREEFQRISAEEFSGYGVCQSCGQPLPVDKVAEARSLFNKSRSNRLEEINRIGKENNDRIADLLAEKKNTEEQLAQLQFEAGKVSSEIEDIKKTVKELEEELADGFTRQQEYKAFVDKKAELEDEIKKLEADIAPAVERIKKEITITDEQIIRHERLIAIFSEIEKHEKRIEELSAEERELSEEFVSLDGKLAMVEEYVMAKINRLEEAINSRFKIVSFRLFEKQINDGLRETCELTVNLVPYKSLNSAAKIQGGLDIINTLSEYYDFYPPCFIDNRESVTEIPEMKAQKISLIVSPDDETLRIEKTTEA